MKAQRILLGAIALALMSLVMAACSTTQGGLTAEQQQQIAIDSLGDVAAIGCGLLVSKASPGDLQKARLAAAAAKTALADPAPNIQTIGAALSQGLPPEYASLGAVLVQRVKVRLGGANVIPVDSVGYKMAESFVDACGLALGSAPAG